MSDFFIENVQNNLVKLGIKYLGNSMSTFLGKEKYCTDNDRQFYGVLKTKIYQNAKYCGRFSELK